MTSDIEEAGKLCIEGVYGICDIIPLKILERQFKDLSPAGLHIDVVGLALPHSVGLGKVFLKNGVKHVLCFDDANPNYKAS